MLSLVHNHIASVADAITHTGNVHLTFEPNGMHHSSLIVIVIATGHSLPDYWLVFPRQLLINSLFVHRGIPLFSWGLHKFLSSPHQVMPSAAQTKQHWDKACTQTTHIHRCLCNWSIVYTGTSFLWLVGWVQPHSEWGRFSVVRKVSVTMDTTTQISSEC